jgi:hypothetical protein
VTSISKDSQHHRTQEQSSSDLELIKLKKTFEYKGEERSRCLKGFENEKLLNLQILPKFLEV